MSRARNAQAGLTLIELLIALGIFAVVGMASAAVLNAGLNGQRQVEAISASNAALERARAVVRTDLLSAIDRPYQNGIGDGEVPAFIGGPLAERYFDTPQGGGEYLMAFVRTGWANPDAAEPRSSLQGVAYFRREGALYREIRAHVDAAPGTPRSARVLLEGAEGIEILFLVKGEWRDEVSSSTEGRLPEAVRLRYEDPVYGLLVQDFIVGGTE